MLEREIALYLRLIEKGVRVAFITYGGRDDLGYADQLGGIEILSNRWNLPPRWYERLLPLLHAQSLRQADIYKTNQTNGADLALRAARIWHKPLIARCGYMWSQFAQQRGATAEAENARRIEKHLFEHAQRTVVTTPAMKQFIEDKYLTDKKSIFIIPNYVMTDQFSPGNMKPDPNRICCVGRLEEQKNLRSLLRACQSLPVQLHLIGDGHLRAALQEEAEQSGIDLVLHGNLPHNQIPEIIRRASIFALVSHYEGHPKSLLEAMSCGAAVLGADSPGIREQIIHGETGWLVKIDAESIRSGIQHLLANQALRVTLGRNARNFVQENYALDRIVSMEYALYREILTG